MNAFIYVIIAYLVLSANVQTGKTLQGGHSYISLDFTPGLVPKRVKAVYKHLMNIINYKDKNKS